MRKRLAAAAARHNHILIHAHLFVEEEEEKKEKVQVMLSCSINKSAQLIRKRISGRVCVSDKQTKNLWHGSQ